MDGEECRLTIHHQQSVLAQRDTKRVHLVAPEHAESVTVVGCCNAIGNTIPPMNIYRSKRSKPEFSDNLPPGNIVRMAPKGSVTTELFTEFLRDLARYKGPNAISLVFDRTCHLDYEIVKAAEEHNIKLFCLPSNTTYGLQPLDKYVYRSFELHWGQELLGFWDQHTDRTLTKIRFNEVFSKVWPKCMTPANIISGFGATGLYPFNPEAIPEHAFVPPIPTEIPAPAEDQYYLF
ncbi:hypothetical protein JTB14_001317 [Gonioctena quinquepunctata]|nr:hypothetical protein JTB14_001317 [Gonioctena quinquepunctata]